MTMTITQEEQDLLNYIIEDYILGAEPRDAGPAQKLKIKLTEPDWGEKPDAFDESDDPRDYQGPKWK